MNGGEPVQRRNIHDHPEADEDEVVDFLNAHLALEKKWKKINFEGYIAEGYHCRMLLVRIRKLIIYVAIMFY